MYVANAFFYVLCSIRDEGWFESFHVFGLLARGCGCMRPNERGLIAAGEGDASGADGGASGADSRPSGVDDKAFVTRNPAALVAAAAAAAGAGFSVSARAPAVAAAAASAPLKWRRVVDPSDGVVFFERGAESAWELPPGALVEGEDAPAAKQWRRIVDPTDGAVYFERENEAGETESVWDLPPGDSIV